MKTILRAAVICVLAGAASAANVEVISTKCQTTDVDLGGGQLDQRLIGCGDGFPNDVLWHLDRLDSIDGTLDNTLHRWATGRGSVVYVGDVGVQRKHQEFARANGTNVIGGINAVTAAGGKPITCDNDPVLDPCFQGTGAALFILTHGTAVASVLAGKNVGVAPDAQIVSVLVESTPKVWLKALDLIVQHAFDPSTPPFRTAIVNISGGIDNSKGSSSVAEVEKKIRTMIGGVDANGNPDPNGKRFLFVAAAGNSGDRQTGTGFLGQCDANGNVRQYPAVLGPDIDGLISVGGMTRDNVRWTGACGGPLVEILAPAEKMLEASISGPDHYRGAVPVDGTSGTSYSTPYVSGIAALMLELDPNLTPADLEARIKSSVSFVSNPDDTAGGRVAVFPVPQPPHPRRRAVR
jgi:subtilisin family serine protease